MFKNWLKTALRNLTRNSTYSFLNIFGLAIGIACAGLILLWVEDEYSYDHMYPKRDRLYSIIIHHNMEGKMFTFQTNSTPKLLAQSLKNEIPAIANTCRFSWANTQLFSVGDKAIDQTGYYADSTVFSMFDLNFIQGRPQNALSEPNNIVITSRMAERLFGDPAEAIGKMVKLDNRENMRVSGVVATPPTNSTIQFDFLGSMELFIREHPNLSDWNSYSLNTYVELRAGSSVADVNAQITNFLRTHADERAGTPALLSMNDWRLRSAFEEGKQTGGRITYVRLFTFVAIIILLIACINFMNLATARSEKRAREVGVRKVMGAHRLVIVAQFISEALLMSFIATVVAVVIMLMVLPHFSAMVEKPMSLDLHEPLHVGALLALIVICGCLAGSYPALYLSSFRPVVVLKSLKIPGVGAALVRKVLVVGQFAVSVILIIGAIVIYRQINHAKQRDIGYDKNNMLTVGIRGNMLDHFDVVKNDLLKTGKVESVALCSYNTVDFGNNTTAFQWQGKDPDAQVLVSIRSVDPGFLETTGMKLIGGRNFLKDAAQDSMRVIITASLQKQMGEGSAVGKYITIPTRNDSIFKFEVVGVINDYVYGNLYSKSEPVLLFCRPQDGENIYVRLKTGNTREAVAEIETVMKKHNPAYPFTYRFVDDHFNEQFKAEVLISNLSWIFTILALLISCLGLFGLAAHTAERRTREISIRKVLGADAKTIVGLLAKEFVALIALSCMVGFPVAWWLMNDWLQDYPYRIELGAGVFVLTAALLMFVAVATISVQSVKLALSNPARTLRSE